METELGEIRNKDDLEENMSEERLQDRGGGGLLKGTDPDLLKVLDLYDQGQREHRRRRLLTIIPRLPHMTV